MHLRSWQHFPKFHKYQCWIRLLVGFLCGTLNLSLVICCATNIFGNISCVQGQFGTLSGLSIDFLHGNDGDQVQSIHCLNHFRTFVFEHLVYFLLYSLLADTIPALVALYTNFMYQFHCSFGQKTFYLLGLFYILESILCDPCLLPPSLQDDFPARLSRRCWQILAQNCYTFY